MSDPGILTSVVTTVIKAAIEHGIPAGATFLLGGAGGAALANFVSRNPLNNSDFRIKTEATAVQFAPKPGNASHLYVNVKRRFTLKLRDDHKKGRYEISVDLNGNNVQGRWEEDCAVWLDQSNPLQLRFEKERSIIKAKTPRLTTRDTLTVILNSVETISKARRFYALFISNPKDQTTFHWTVNPALEDVRVSSRAFASSEDFDLAFLPEGGAHPIQESLHPVTYFITW